MRSSVLLYALAVFLCRNDRIFGQGLSNVFDRDFTETYQGGFSSTGNWTDNVQPFPLVPNAAGLFFATANDSDNVFPGVGMTKDLGGSILNVPYTITMQVACYGGDLSPVLFSDFSVLRIGGASGTVLWTDTPSPTANSQWTQWTGTYTPSPTDVGNDFVFEAVFDLEARRSFAIDGPVTATPTPEPSAGLLLAMGGAAFSACARRRRAR